MREIRVIVKLSEWNLTFNKATHKLSETETGTTYKFLCFTLTSYHKKDK